MDSSTDGTRQWKADAWLGLSVGMVLVSVIGLLYIYLAH